jgi:dTDP-4-amino-4,6-dideoxygalactose transaminase
MEPYLSLYPGLSLPATERLAARVVTLPAGAALELEDVVAVAGLVRLIVENAGDLPERLPDFRDGRPSRSSGV